MAEAKDDAGVMERMNETLKRMHATHPQSQKAVTDKNKLCLLTLKGKGSFANIGKRSSKKG